MVTGYMHPWATALGHAGKLPPPPDPAVFAELKDIVEGRLKESLNRYVLSNCPHVWSGPDGWLMVVSGFDWCMLGWNRLVVATYNNVGMPRAYCGSAGGFAIGLIGRCVCPFVSSRVIPDLRTAPRRSRRASLWAGRDGIVCSHSRACGSE